MGGIIAWYVDCELPVCLCVCVYACVYVCVSGCYCCGGGGVVVQFAV